MLQTDGLSTRERKELLASAIREKALREERRRQSNPHGGLLDFVRYFWNVLEPVDEFVEGWTLECLCAHLEAITRGDTIIIHDQERIFNRLLANVPPGFMKSLLVNVFWPAWEWGPQGMPHLRYVCFSYNRELTVRDNTKFRDLVCSQQYRELWGHVFEIVADGVERVRNDKTGFKFASSFGGTGTGERGHRVLLDDPHKLKGTQETAEAREAVTNWVLEAMQNRLNDLQRDAIVIIMQRVHEADTSAKIIEHRGDEYCWLAVPMEFESGRHFTHYTGWNDGRDPREDGGDVLAWPERYPLHTLAPYKRNAYLWSGQYQQTPTPRGGGLFKDDWWQAYEIPKDGMYDFVPQFTVASLDTAYKEEQENDYNALTVWQVYDDPKTGQRRIMLVDAWKKRLPLHGKSVERQKGEEERTYLRRASKHWGLCEWVKFTCDKRGVDRLLVEDSARGIDVNNEIRRLFMNENWGVLLVPARGDKWVRAQAVVDLFVDDMIYAPGEWKGGDDHVDGAQWWWRGHAQEVIMELGQFPRGAHDDYVDSVTMALRHLREINMAIRREERHFLEKQMALYKKPSTPLYPA